MATEKIRNPWWMKPFNLLYKWFGIVLIIQTNQPNHKWLISMYKLNKKPK